MRNLSRLNITHIFGSITRIAKIFTNVVDGMKARDDGEVAQRDAEVVDGIGSESRRYVYCAVYINGMVCYERGSNGIKIL
ncbi:hypothetical protein Igag_1711 [Ignisphaera aggregans DSM 17230]|uniref:Uncharacterized protein n=1 Tax=Ignisphaera aggregans (strain DSM 17230 / JCM 13409 / AQ1.S1) TaxID=583356 RepID=E0SS51_IGNAA|nr:hypothetical protein Igag_1711 [Ignisphaera aggregans DSM 17230]